MNYKRDMRTARATIVSTVLLAIAMSAADYDRPAPQTIEVGKGIYLFITKPYGEVGMDGNSVAILSRDGVLVFDSNGTPAASPPARLQARRARRAVPPPRGPAGWNRSS